MTVDPLKELTFPALYCSVDEISANHQRKFFKSIRLQAIALAIAAAASVIPEGVLANVGPIVAVIMFVAVILVQVTPLSSVSEKKWYDARAAAESIKSASWQFAVGGESFRIDDEEAEARFQGRISELLASLPVLDQPATSLEDGSVTDRMRAARAADLEARREFYIKFRIQDQFEWYSKKARFNGKRARLARAVLVGISIVAMIAGILRIKGLLDVDVVSVLATVASGVLLWSQAKKYTTLSESYSVTSHEVGLISSTIKTSPSEAEWAQAVHDAEAAFSREHTMWSARRQGPL